MIKDSYPLYLSMVKDGYFRGEEREFDTAKLKEALRTVEDSDNIIENLHIEYVIAASSYNRILKEMGKEEITLAKHQTAIYSSESENGYFGSILEKTLKKGPSVGIDGTD